MSMNVFLVAKQDAVLANGKKFVHEVGIDLWQTPTKITKKIINSSDPLKVYTEWVKEISHDKKWPVYADDDFFCEREPISYEIVNDGKDHLKELNETIQTLISNGYELEWGER